MGTIEKGDSGAQKEHANKSFRDEHGKIRIANIFKKGIELLLEKFSDNLEDTESFKLFAKFAEERGYHAMIDRGRGQKLLDKECVWGISAFWAEDRVVKKVKGEKYFVKIVYIPKCVLERTDRLLKMDRTFVENAFHMLIAHEHYERELILKNQTEKIEGRPSESEVNKLVADEIKDKQKIVEMFSDFLAYECLLLPVNEKWQILMSIPNEMDDKVREEIQTTTKEKIDKFYGILYEKEIKEFQERLNEWKNSP